MKDFSGIDKLIMKEGSTLFYWIAKLEEWECGAGGGCHIEWSQADKDGPAVGGREESGRERG